MGIQRLLPIGTRTSEGHAFPCTCPSRTPPPLHESLVTTPCSHLIVSQFTGPNASSMGQIVVAGPSNSVVIDKQGMYWMAGKVSHFQLYRNGSNLTFPLYSGKTREMVSPRYLNVFFGTLTAADPRFCWIPVHPLPSHPGYHVGLSPEDACDDTDAISGDAKSRTLVVGA